MKELDKKVGNDDSLTLSRDKSLCYSIPQVNIIPIIAKADTIARSELPQFKARVSTLTPSLSLYLLMWLHVCSSLAS